MTYAIHEINALITIDPSKAKDEICKALRSAGMHKGNAAEELGCAHTTLLRWIERLQLETKISKMMVQAEKEGWRFNGRTGRPAGSTVENGAKPRVVKKKAKSRRQGASAR